MKTKRRPSLDVARATANLQVLLEHALLWAAAIGLSDPVVDTAARHVIVNVAIFLMVSGVLLRRAVVEDVPFTVFIRRRIMPTLWVYLVWHVSVFAYRLVAGLGGIAERPYDLTAELGRTALLLVRPNGELWYLWVLMVGLILLRLLRSVPSAWLVSVSAASFVVMGLFSQVLLPEGVWDLLGLGWQRLISNGLFLVLGVRFGPQIISIASGTRWWLLAAVGLAWQASMVATIQLGPGLFQFVSVIAGTWFYVALAERIADTGLGRRLALLGRNILPIYLAHMPIMALASVVLVSSGLAEVFRGSIAYEGGLVVGLLVLAVTGSLVAYRLADRIGLGFLYGAPRWWTELGAGVRRRAHRVG